jgi:hypothetical protein
MSVGNSNSVAIFVGNKKNNTDGNTDGITDGSARQKKFPPPSYLQNISVCKI